MPGLHGSPNILGRTEGDFRANNFSNSYVSAFLLAADGKGNLR